MAEAYVLAAALRASGSDYHTAFKRYQTCLTPVLKRKQESVSKFATSFVPKTALGIAFRNVVTRLLGMPEARAERASQITCRAATGKRTPWSRRCGRRR